MDAVERFARRMRHSRLLGRLDGFWSLIRPSYDAVLRWTSGRRGLRRLMNGTDEVRIDVSQRNLGEEYEPEVWRSLMAAVRPGDTVADVGAFVGLYSIAMAKRIGERGRVVAFEPDPASAAALRRHVELNRVAGKIVVYEAAAGAEKGEVTLASAGIDFPHVLPRGSPGRRVPMVALDDVFPAEPVHVIKMDVEGFEEQVLLGARTMLSDPARRPRIMFIEVHPLRWAAFGTSSDSLLRTLAASGYRTRTLAGEPIARLDRWGEIIAEPEERER